MKFSPYGQTGSKSPMTFDTVKEHILNTIQRTYRHRKDVVDSLRDMEEIDLTNFQPLMGEVALGEEATLKMKKKAIQMKF